MTDISKDIPFQSKKKLGDLSSLTTTVQSHTAQLTDIVTLTPPPNGIDDTATLKAFFALGYKNVKFRPGTYNVKINNGESLFTFQDSSNIKIDGTEALLKESSDPLIHTSFSSFFTFNNCDNVSVDINVEGKEIVDKNVDFGYKGLIGVYLKKECRNSTIKVNGKDIRYGVNAGAHAFSEAWSCGHNNLTLKVAGKNIGYPVAIYGSDALNIDVDVDTCHRAVYLAGINVAKVDARFKNQYIADTFVLMTDSYDKDGALRGCTNIDIKAVDKGSAVFQGSSTCVGIIPNRDAVPTYYKNIKANVYVKATDTLSTKIGGFRIASGSPGWGAGTELSNIKISGVIDKSELTSFPVCTRPVVINQTGVNIPIVTDIVLDQFTMPNINTSTIPDSYNLLLKKTVNVALENCNLGNVGTSMTDGKLTVNNSNLGKITLPIAGVNLYANNSKFELSGMSKSNASKTYLTNCDSDTFFSGKMQTSVVDYTLTGTQVDCGKLMDSQSILLGVHAEIIDTITGSSGFTLGTTTTADRFCNTGSTAIGFKSNNANYHATLANLPEIIRVNTNLYINSKTSDFTGGKIRLTVLKIQF